jgi:hypothetical protein
MRKITIRLGVAVVAFLVGTFTAGILAIKQPLPAAEQPTLKRAVANEALKPDSPLEWKKITIGRVSFRAPSQLKPIGPPFSGWVVKALSGEVTKGTPSQLLPGIVTEGEGLYLYYAYGKHVPSDLNTPSGQSKEVMISGRTGRLWVWEPDLYGSEIKWRLESTTMELCIPDIGDGKTKFELYVAGRDLSLLRQVIDSVKIR